MDSLPTLIWVAGGVVVGYFTLRYLTRPAHKLPPPMTGQYPLVGPMPSMRKYVKELRLHDWLHAIPKENGPICRFNMFGMQTVVVSDAEANKKVFTDEAFSRTLLVQTFL